MTTGTKHLALFVWNVVPIVNIASLARTSGLVFGLASFSGVLNSSDITQIRSYLADNQAQIQSSQKILKHFNVTTTFASNILLLFDDLPTIYVLYSKYLLFLLFIL